MCVTAPWGLTCPELDVLCMHITRIKLFKTECIHRNKTEEIYDKENKTKKKTYKNCGGYLGLK